MTQSIKILLVEDEVITALLIKMELGKIGYHDINHVTTGESAVSSVTHDLPDLILMDIRLAGEMDGIQATTKINETANVPVVFLSGYDDQETRKQVEKLSPLAFLPKPVDFMRLTNVLDGYRGFMR